MASFKKIFISLIFIISFLSHFTAAGLVRRSNDCGNALKHFCKGVEKGKIECVCDEFELYLSGGYCDASHSITISACLEILEKLEVCDIVASVDEHQDIAAELLTACNQTI
ncbi:12229_t:CDS:2, partial [Cetraspora pellucida]